jgi:hypothetical protein
MSPDFHKKWAHIIEDVDKHTIPIEFIKKLIVKLQGRRQHTINVEKLLKQGMFTDTVEDVVSRKLIELDEQVVSIEFILNIETIAQAVEPETEKILNRL